jgi:hypothetical protein
MPVTYEPIATQTLGGTSTTITFSSIPSTYTDLKVVLSFAMTGFSNITFRLNGDATSGNYPSIELISGSLSTTYFGSASYSNASGMITYDVFSYSGTSLYKYLFGTSFATGSSGTNSYKWSGQWRSTSAVTSITLGCSTFAAGTIATLYGIKAA